MLRQESAVPLVEMGVEGRRCLPLREVLQEPYRFATCERCGVLRVTEGENVTWIIRSADLERRVFRAGPSGTGIESPLCMQPSRPFVPPDVVG